LALGVLHEVVGGGNGAVDGAAAALFAAWIAARTKGLVLWCVTARICSPQRWRRPRSRRTV
jgi:protein ImuA